MIVIVGSIIAQIIKARKNAKNPPPKSPKRQSGSADRDFTASSNELQNFLESIGAAKPPAVPQQVVQKPVRRPAQPVHVRREVASAPPPLPAHSRLKHRQSPLETKLEQERNFKAPQPQHQESQPVNATEIIGRESSAITRLIRKELRDLDATRKSIAIREILGPPISLR